MPKDKNAVKLRAVRHARLRKKLSGNPSRPRLCVFRSLKHIYAQIIDDTAGATIASATSHEAVKPGDGTSKIAAAVAVGKLVAERAKAVGVTTVVFDRGGYKFHGRVKALAEATREEGILF